MPSVGHTDYDANLLASAPVATKAQLQVRLSKVMTFSQKLTIFIVRIYYRFAGRQKTSRPKSRRCRSRSKQCRETSTSDSQYDRRFYTSQTITNTFSSHQKGYHHHCSSG